jgi:hypothetical protein
MIAASRTENIRYDRGRKTKMLAKKPLSQKKVSGLMAAQVFDGEWAIVSDSRKALTESEANQIIAAYMAVNELLKSTI